ncbi:MAG TPA: hypothetical protein PKD86_11065 [Gemmatales bacterium]|nr:hypothetical protein [Gemmatales bacterium]HMP59885.1 hypothetical protein [Gemmatales bacterium]
MAMTLAMKPASLSWKTGKGWQATLLGWACGLACAGCMGPPKNTTPELPAMPRASGPLPLVEETLALAEITKELPGTGESGPERLLAGAPPVMPELVPASAPEAPPHITPALAQELVVTPPRPVRSALDAYLRHGPEAAAQALEALPAKDQEVMQRLLPFLAEMEKNGLFVASLSKERAQAFISTLQMIEGDLTTLAPLALEELTFCRSIDGFGRYVPRPAQFRAGDTTWVYAELRHINDVKLADGKFGIQLQGQLEVIRADGQLAVPPSVMESGGTYSRSQRRDFFLRFGYTIPSQLPPGSYTLRLVITDRATGRKAESSIKFRVAAEGP